MGITLEHVMKRYDGRLIVHGISLEIAEGEMFVLLGPSGSGKSTVLRLIAGLTNVDSGSIRLLGQDVTHLPPQRRGIGFVFQHYALFQHMTAAENIEFGMHIQRIGGRERRLRRDELLEMVGLAGLGNRLPRQLSGGQQQRVALARALATRPKVLLLDEPFGALDTHIRGEMRTSLRSIQRDLGITAIFVTHDQEEAFALGDRLGIMRAGRLLEVGPPDELYLRPQTEFVATFLGSANLLVGTASSTGLELGGVHFPLRTLAEQTAEPRRVQVLFRPEDISLAPTRAELGGTALGQASVQQSTFVGSFERLQLRLPMIPGVRPISPPVPFGADYLPIEATRSQSQARQYPLATGDHVWLGVLRLHALAHPGMQFLIALQNSAADKTVLTFGHELARLAHARATVLGAGFDEPLLHTFLSTAEHSLGNLPGLQVRVTPYPVGDAITTEVEREPYDLVMLGTVPPPMETIEKVLGAGDQHILLIPPDCDRMPTRALVCVAGNEASKFGVEFVGRLFRHLGMEATLLTVMADDSPEVETPDRQRAQRFLEASERSLSVLGVKSQSIVRSGSLRETISGEMARGGYELLVLGAPLRPFNTARIRPFLTGQSNFSVLIARSPYAAVGSHGVVVSDNLVEESL